jgi:hypothetical protein
MTAWYKIFWEEEPNDCPESLRLLTGQPGLLKKGETATIRVLFSPAKVGRCAATLKIVNQLMKEVFKIEGKAVHSSKIEH